MSSDARARLPALQRTCAKVWQIAHSGDDDRSYRGFLAHPFILAVPTSGVNNPFDYPLGLPYLIFLGPCVFFSVLAVRRGRLPVLPFLAFLLWAGWWCSSHQARFLYIPLILIFVSTAAEADVVESLGPWCALFIAAGLTSISMVRNNRPDFGKTDWQVLRPKDQALVQFGEALKAHPRPLPIEWPDKEVPYATFPVHVSRGDSFVIPSEPPAGSATN